MQAPCVLLLKIGALCLLTGVLDVGGDIHRVRGLVVCQFGQHAFFLALIMVLDQVFQAALVV